MTTQIETATEHLALTTNHAAPLPNATPLLPRGELTLLVGDPAIGKSLLALDFAARITNNSPPLPNPLTIQPCTGEDSPLNDDFRPANVLILSREDSQPTITGRLLAAGANLSRIRLITDAVGSLIPLHYNNRPESIYDIRKEKRSPSPLLKNLEHNRKEYGNLGLIILDPLPACLGIHDSHHPSTVRNLLMPLLYYARENHIAILGITHLTKSRRNMETNPLNHLLGSIAYPALARSILFLTRDFLSPSPLSPRSSRTLLVPLKLTNLPITHAYAFTLAEKRFPAFHPSITKQKRKSYEPFPLDGPEFLNTCHPRIEWDKTKIYNHPTLPSYQPPQGSELTTQDSEDAEFNRSELQIASDFLRTALEKGPRPSAEILREARNLGLAQRTLRRARYALHIRPRHEGVKNTWLLALPETAPKADPSPLP